MRSARLDHRAVLIGVGFALLSAACSDADPAGLPGVPGRSSPSTSIAGSSTTGAATTPAPSTAPAPSTTLAPSTTPAPSTAPAPSTTLAPSTTAPAPTTTAPAATPTTSGEISSPAAVGPVASSGCERPAEPGPSSLTLVHDGMERAYDLFSPPAPLHEGPLPLVLDFHGATATAGNEAAVTGFTDLAAQEGFFVVNPQGSGLLSYWNIESTSSTRLADDVGFVVALLDEIGAARCVDLTRIHATGISNGGMFSSTLACALADRIASFAPVAGTHVPPDCGSPPVPLLITHGTDDPIVPYDGSGLLGDILGSGVLGLLTGDLGPMFSVTTTPIPEWVATWADHNGCDPTPSSARIEPDVEVRTYGGCDGRGALVFQVVEDGGHVWPGSTAHVDSEAIAGRTSMTIHATRRAWDFFASHPLPADLVGATP